MAVLDDENRQALKDTIHEMDRRYLELDDKERARLARLKSSLLDDNIAQRDRASLQSIGNLFGDAVTVDNARSDNANNWGREDT